MADGGAGGVVKAAVLGFIILEQIKDCFDSFELKQSFLYCKLLSS